jgi:hypothetical protein
VVEGTSPPKAAGSLETGYARDRGKSESFTDPGAIPGGSAEERKHMRAKKKRKRPDLKVNDTSPILLGDTVRDVYTGFQGTALARTDWLYGCTRILVEPTKLTKEGAVAANVEFDEQRLVGVKRDPLRNFAPWVDEGGPKPSPKAPRTPTRF